MNQIKLNLGTSIIIGIILSMFNYNNLNAQITDKLTKTLGDTNFEIFQTHLRDLNSNIISKGIIYDTVYKCKLLTGYSYGQFYDWDLYFENIYLSYYGISEYNFTNLNVFFSFQQSDGFIKRAFGTKPWGKNQMFKPFIAQIVLLGSLQQGNFDWSRQHYSQMKLYLKKWFEYDSDKNGLIYWPGGSDHSGMDNQNTRCLGKSEGVDLNCYLYRELIAMSIIADNLGFIVDKNEYQNHAERLKVLINKYLVDFKCLQRQ